MELHIKDRLYLQQILPGQTKSFIDFNVKRSIIKKIALTEKDQKEFKIEEDAESHRVTWNAAKDAKSPIKVDFTTDEMTMLKNACEQLPETAYPDDFWLTVEKIYNAASSN